MFPEPKNVDKNPCRYVYFCYASARLAKHLLAQFRSILKIYYQTLTSCFEPFQTSTPFWPKNLDFIKCFVAFIFKIEAQTNTLLINTTNKHY